MAIICAGCGTSAEPDERFCSQCGAPLSTGTSTSTDGGRRRSSGSPTGVLVFFLLIIVAGGWFLFKYYRPKAPPKPPTTAVLHTFAPPTVAVYADFDPRPVSSSASLAWPLALVLDSTLDWSTERARIQPILADLAGNVVPWTGSRCILAAGLDNKNNWIAAVSVLDATAAHAYTDQKLRSPDSGTWRDEPHGTAIMELPADATHPCYALLPDFLVLASDRETLAAALDTWSGNLPSFLTTPRWQASDLSPERDLTMWVDGPYATAALLRLTDQDSDAAGSPLASDRFKKFAGGIKSLTVEGFSDSDGAFAVHVLASPVEGSADPFWQALHASAAPQTPGLATLVPVDDMGLLLCSPTLAFNLYQAWNGSHYLVAAPSPSPSPSPEVVVNTPTGTPTEPVNTPKPHPSVASPEPGASEVPVAPHADAALQGLGGDMVVAMGLYAQSATDVESALTDCTANLKQLAAQIELYKVDHKEFPHDLTDLLPRYLQKLPICPAGGKYQYQRSDDGSTYHLTCQGEAHRAAGLSSNAPSFDSAEGLNAERPDLGALEVFLRQPTVLVASLADPQAFQAAVKSYITEQSIGTEEINHDPLVLDLGNWVDLAYRTNQVVAGVGPVQDVVRSMADISKAPQKSMADRLVDARSTAGTTPNLMVYIDPGRFGSALETALNPTPSAVTMESFKTIRSAWLTVAPQGPNLSVWLSLKK